MAKTTKKNEKKDLKIQDFPYVEFTVRAYNTRATDKTGGRGIMTMCGFDSTVSEGDEELGYIAGGLGSVVISITNGGYFMIPHNELWCALQEASKQGDTK